MPPEYPNSTGRSAPAKPGGTPGRRAGVAVTGDYARIAAALADWEKLADVADIAFFHAPFADDDAAAAALRPFEVICHTRERLPMSRALLARLPALRYMTVTGRAHRTLDLEAARARGVVVSHASRDDPPNPSTPEYAWALLLAAARQVPRADAACRRGRWEPPVGLELQGKTLGIVGLGQVGSQVAGIARAFGMRVIAWSPHLTSERAQQCGAEAVGKHALFESADVVSLHLVLGPTTERIVGEAELSRMRSQAILVNTARGGLVDQAALVRALQEGRIAAAALDVFETEPLPADDPLTRLDNVVLSPHAGYSTRETYGRFYGATVRMLQAFFAGRTMNRL